VKEVVPMSTSDNGHTILNADDDLVYAMAENVSCGVILFSTKANNPRVADHCSNGGMAVIIENGYYVICEGKLKTRLVAVNQVPVTLEGKAEFMAANVLPAIAAGLVSGFSNEVIQEALLSFIPSAELTPGRMNLFEFGHCNVMLDYAHNAAGFEGIQKYMSQIDSPYKMCVIGATGDRRDEDIRNLGRYAATIFDEVIIRHDEDGRGRPNEEMTDLIMSGIYSVDRNKTVRVISDEQLAIESALALAPHNAFIFVCADHVKHSIEIIKGLQQKQALMAEKQAS
jgi:cyanophycin synthetase